MTFARGLRAILRQDPDVVMVGEIRDLETAEIAVQASLTGHLVLSTLHTNTAVGAVTRLRDMGIEPFLLSSSLIGVLAQRLVRMLDPATREVPGRDHQCRGSHEGDAGGVRACEKTSRLLRLPPNVPGGVALRENCGHLPGTSPLFSPSVPCQERPATPSLPRSNFSQAPSGRRTHLARVSSG
jgi:hypothetical protein